MEGNIHLQHKFKKLTHSQPIQKNQMKGEKDHSTSVSIILNDNEPSKKSQLRSQKNNNKQKQVKRKADIQIEKQMPTRNLLIDTQNAHNNNSTIKMAYTCGNNSQVQDEMVHINLPLQSIDNKQIAGLSQQQKQQLFQLFSPSKLLTTNKPDQKDLLAFSDSKFIQDQTPPNYIEQNNSVEDQSAISTEPLKTQLDKFYSNQLNGPINECGQNKITKVLDFDKVNEEVLQRKLRDLIMKNEESDDERYYKTTDKVQDGPYLEDSDMQIRARNQMEDSSVVVLSQVQSQADLLRPHTTYKRFEQQLLRSPQDVKRKSPVYFSSTRKMKGFEESDASSVFNENVGLFEGFDQRLKSKQFLNDVQNPKYFSNDPMKVLVVEENEEDDNQSVITAKNFQSSKKVNKLLDLNLRLANVREIPISIFTQNMFLRSIDVRNNRISKIPDQICDLTNLWKLRIDYNYITELPERIGTLQTLEYLSASQNQLNYLPSSLFQLGDSLQSLIINDNKLKFLSEKVGLLNNLHVLLLHNNQLSEIPFAICMHKLDELSLDWFIYQDSQKSLGKHLKGDLGSLHIKEFQNFLKIFLKINENQTQHISFVHYVMFHHKQKNVSEIQLISFFTKKRSIFHLMALNGHLYLFQELFQKFGHLYLDYNRADLDESTPFLLAIRNKRKNFFKFLLSLPNTNINRPSNKYGNPLHLALKSQEMKLALQLLKGGGKEFHRQVDVNSLNEDGNNALHYLFMNFNVKPEIAREITRLLIKRHININFKNKSNLAPVHLAVLSNQVDAVNFALEYNKMIRAKLDKSNQSNVCLFDFNLKGGKYNQNPLQMSIQQSNFKIISALLSSEEFLDFMAVDDEGRVPKDICPYNSPIYKLLTQYEIHYHQRINQLHSNSQLKSMKLDIVQYYYNKRHYESPTKIRMRILEKALIKDKQQSQMHKMRGRTVVQTCKNANQKAMFSHMKQGCNRLQSLNERYHGESNLQSQKILDDLMPSDCDDEEEIQVSQVNFRTQRSCQQSYNNFSLIAHDGRDSKKPSLIPVLQKDMSIEQMLKPDDQFEKDLKSHRLRNIRISISSNESMNSKTINRDSNNSFRYQELPKPFRQKEIVVTNVNNTESRVFASIEKPKFNQNNESVLKEKLEDDEDDANIPEEDHEYEVELQKSQMRIFNKSPSQHGFNSDNNNKELDQKALVKIIINEVQKQRDLRQKFLSNNEIQTNMSNYLSVPTQDLILHSSIINNSVNQQITQEQGNLNKEGSQIFQVEDESMVIQLPFDPKQDSKMNSMQINKPPFVIGFMQRTCSKYNNSLLDFEEKNHLIYQKFFKYLAKKNYQGCLSAYSDLNKNQINIVNIDLAYYIGLNSSYHDLKKIMIVFDQNPNKNVTKKINQLFAFELINNHDVKLYEKYNRAQMKLIGNINPQSIRKSQNIRESLSRLTFNDGPLLKVKMNKSPSLQFTDNEIDPFQQPLSINERTRNDLHLGLSTSEIVSTTQMQPTGNTPKGPIFDIKQIIMRKSVDISDGKKPPLLLYQGSDIFKQVKKPLVDREKEYLKIIEQEQKNCLDQFSQNCKMFRNASTHSSKESKASKQSSTQAVPKNSKYLQHIQNKQSQKKKTTPFVHKLASQMTYSSRKLEYQQRVQIFDYQKPKSIHVLNSAPGKQRKIQAVSRNTQIFTSEDTVEQKNQISQSESKTKLKNESTYEDNPPEYIINQNLLYNEEFENLQDQLRIKNKWQILKQSHTIKMNKVQQSAVKRKNMFSQDAFDSNRSNSIFILNESKYNSQSYLTKVQVNQTQTQQNTKREKVRVLVNHDTGSKPQSPKHSYNPEGFINRKSSILSDQEKRINKTSKTKIDTLNRMKMIKQMSHQKLKNKDL